MTSTKYSSLGTDDIDRGDVETVVRIAICDWLLHHHDFVVGPTGKVSSIIRYAARDYPINSTYNFRDIIRNILNTDDNIISWFRNNITQAAQSQKLYIFDPDHLIANKIATLPMLRKHICAVWLIKHKHIVTSLFGLVQTRLINFKINHAKEINKVRTSYRLTMNKGAITAKAARCKERIAKLDQEPKITIEVPISQINGLLAAMTLDPFFKKIYTSKFEFDPTNEETIKAIVQYFTKWPDALKRYPGLSDDIKVMIIQATPNALKYIDAPTERMIKFHNILWEV